MIEPRYFEPLSIHYIICIKEPPPMAGIWETSGLEELCNILSFCPNHFIQLFNPLTYSFCDSIHKEVSFNLSFAHSFDSFKSSCEGSSSLITCIFFLYWDEKIYKWSKTRKESISFFYDLNIPDTKVDGNCFDNFLSLAKLIRSRKQDIISKCDKNREKIEKLLVDIPPQPIDDFQLWRFRPTYTLSAYINNFTGHLWNEEIEEATLPTDQRLSTIIDLLKKADSLYLGSNSALKENIDMSSLVILAPSFPPLYRKPFKNLDKELYIALGTEQDFNYIHSIIVNREISETTHIAQTIKAKTLKEFDVISYLHSTLSKSPMLRLPERGNSVRNSLAKFYNGKRPGKAKLSKELHKQGQIITMNLIPNELEEYVLSVSRQLVILSDLPLEWAVLDNVPIAFLFDICRIPPIPSSRPIFSYAQNKYARYFVNEQTLANHLIISSDDADINAFSPANWKDLVDFKVNGIKCNSVKEVTESINNHKPELLILDCHGSYEESSNSSVLHFGNEKLTFEDINKNVTFPPPLVILSCCNTAPINCIDSIANAFLAKGAFAVLSTFHPIQITTGSVFVLRMLNNLNHSVNHSVHSNWLNFISHTLRTSIFSEYRNLLSERLMKRSNLESKYLYNHKFLDIQNKWQAYSMHFYHRKKCYESLKDDVVNSFSPKLHKQVVALAKDIPLPTEYMFYTHLGRPDLIYFENWYKEHCKPFKEMFYRK